MTHLPGPWQRYSLIINDEIDRSAWLVAKRPLTFRFVIWLEMR